MTSPALIQIRCAVDPVTAMSRLAGSGRFGDHVVYERPGEWVFAAAPLGSVEVDTAETRLRVGGRSARLGAVGSPVEAVESALDALRDACGSDPTCRAYGWIAFEFCAHALGAAHHVPPGTPLAHIMIPRIEVTITESMVTVTGATAAEMAIVAELLVLPAEPMPAARPVDVRADLSGYRHRVAAAVAEIAGGAYRKVILSRRVEVPFRVDVPASYRLGRAHNTPARSFLLRLGGIAAAGFSPELVVAVDEHGVVTTEPLAGTRAFGRGRTRDSLARAELESDPKEIVEHAISVKSSFAEISSIAEPGTTAVTEFMTVRERGSVQHLASTVRGRLAPSRTRWSALAAVFPSVTASGIPKSGSVDAVFRLDGFRGLYSGAVVVFSGTAALEAALVLRAVYQDRATNWLRAGAGIIAQSHPEREFEETCEKLNGVAAYLVPEPGAADAQSLRRSRKAG